MEPQTILKREEIEKAHNQIGAPIGQHFELIVPAIIPLERTTLFN